MRLTICIAEDRPTEVEAIKVLVTSLKTRAPGDYQVVVYHPHENAGLAAHLSAYEDVFLETRDDFVGLGTNLKPAVMMRHLDWPGNRVIWLDSDVIVTRDFMERLLNVPEEAFVVSDMPLVTGALRGDAHAWRWGFEIHREMEFTLNSGVMMASFKHRQLLDAWWDLMQTEAYQGAQSVHLVDRPSHLRRDYDALTALLCSQHFADLELDILRAGSEIIQYTTPASYGLSTRMAHQKTPPHFIHSIGCKPWRAPRPGAKTSYWDRIEMESCPYTLAAIELREQTEIAMPWLTNTSLPTRVTGGLPLSVAGSVAKRLNNLRVGGGDKF